MIRYFYKCGFLNEHYTPTWSFKCPIIVLYRALSMYRYDQPPEQTPQTFQTNYNKWLERSNDCFKFWAVGTVRRGEPRRGAALMCIERQAHTRGFDNSTQNHLLYGVFIK